MEITEVIRHGILTEKSVYLQHSSRPGNAGGWAGHRFKVALEANKYQIKQAVEELFGVKVKKVNTMRMPGKSRTLRTRKTYFRSEARPWKKAIVTLEEGQSIPELQA